MSAIKKILLSLLIVLVLAQAVYMMFERGINRYDVHKMTRLNEILLNNTKYDLLFLGSSRPHCNIYPKIIDSITGLNSYNMGVVGGNIYEFNLILDAYLVNHPAPQWLFLSLDHHSFDIRKKIFNYTQYYPFIANPVIKKSLIANKHYYPIYSILPFLKITEYDDYLKLCAMKGTVGTTEINPGEFQYKGYLSNTTLGIRDTVNDTAPLSSIISNEGVDLLQALIDTCKTRNIKMVFVAQPVYKQMFERKIKIFSKAYRIIEAYTKKTNAPLWRHDHLPICNEPTLFANVGHLNKRGSFIYSEILAKQIKEYIDTLK